VGIVRGPDGHEEPVRLVRAARDPEVPWLFSSATVGRIDGWYEELGAAWLRERLPLPLQREGWAHLYWWQWIGVLAALPVLVLVAWGASLAGRFVLTRIAHRTASEWDDLILEHIPGPFRLAVAALAAGPVLGVLALNARAQALVAGGRRGLLLLALFWGVLRVITVAQRLPRAAVPHGCRGPCSDGADDLRGWNPGGVAGRGDRGEHLQVAFAAPR
jgi:hypothetical protein